MGKLKALICAGLVSLAPQLARAADLLPPPPPLEHPMLRGAIEPDGGFYLRGDIGVGINTIGGTSSTFSVAVPGFQYDSAHLGDTTFIGAGFGYQFNSWFRADFTGEYRGSANYSGVESYTSGACGGTRCSDFYTGSIRSAVFLANGYVDLGTWYGVSPFLGVGLGWAHHMAGTTMDIGIGLPGTPGGYSGNTSTNAFAWALMAGIGYWVNPHLKLEMGYRYLNMGTYDSGPIVCNAGCTNEVQHIKLASHDLRFGMRWMFSEPAPVPIVTKY